MNCIESANDTETCNQIHCTLVTSKEGNKHVDTCLPLGNVFLVAPDSVLCIIVQIASASSQQRNAKHLYYLLELPVYRNSDINVIFDIAV